MGGNHMKRWTRRSGPRARTSHVQDGRNQDRRVLSETGKVGWWGCGYRLTQPLHSSARAPKADARPQKRPLTVFVPTSFTAAKKQQQLHVVPALTRPHADQLRGHCAKPEKPGVKGRTLIGCTEVRCLGQTQRRHVGGCPGLGSRGTAGGGVSF